MSRPIFSGHETFRCKTHWLKRGYDFVCEGSNFNDEDAVVKLGVGKNMVASIKFWMKAFGLIDIDNRLSELSHHLLNDSDGKDPFFENMGTLWLLHFELIKTNYATIYKETFVGFHRQYNEINKSTLHKYLQITCFGDIYAKLYNEGSLKKDIDVFLHNYCGASNQNIEERNTLLLPLNLIRTGSEKDSWIFNYINQNLVPAEIFLYTIISSKDTDAVSVPFELLYELALIFCIDNNELIAILNRVCALYPNDIIFSDNAGIKELQFRREFDKVEILKSYYK